SMSNIALGGRYLHEFRVPAVNANTEMGLPAKLVRSTHVTKVDSPNWQRLGFQTGKNSFRSLQTSRVEHFEVTDTIYSMRKRLLRARVLLLRGSWGRMTAHEHPMDTAQEENEPMSASQQRPPTLDSVAPRFLAKDMEQ